jgi:hypothetical protein
MGDGGPARNRRKDEFVLVPKVEKQISSEAPESAHINLSMDGRKPLPRYTALHVDLDGTYWQHSPAGFAY